MGNRTPRHVAQTSRTSFAQRETFTPVASSVDGLIKYYTQYDNDDGVNAEDACLRCAHHCEVRVSRACANFLFGSGLLCARIVY